MKDTSRLVALQTRLSRALLQLDQATCKAARTLREDEVKQAEQELLEEMKCLGMTGAPGEPLGHQTDGLKLAAKGTAGYRPQIGESLFVSLHNGKPFLTTVTGYRTDPRFTSEQFEYIRENGKPNSTSISTALFYPGVPADAAFLYLVKGREEREDGHDNCCDLGYFFDPSTAFEHIDLLESGGELPPHISAEDFKFFTFTVEVEKL